MYRDFDIKIAQNGKYFASSVELNAFLVLAKAFADISEVKDAIDEFWRKNDYICNFVKKLNIDISNKILTELINRYKSKN